MIELPTLPRPGDVVGGNFVLRGELGRGTFGVVFEAEQTDLARRVAIKFLQPSMLDREGIAERFVREARLASSLNNPNAVVIYSFGTHSTVAGARELPYIVMELLEGEDLQRHSASRGPLDIREVVAVLLEALRCLTQAHRLGIIHRDLKPENLFLMRLPNGETRVKVLDFGIAKAVSGNWGSRTLAGVTMAGHVVGTPAYMSPEQARGEPDLGPAVDTYSMACVGFDMLAGHPPYDGRTPMEIALNHITQPTPHIPGLENHPVADVIFRAMSKEPIDRFQDAAAFAEALREAATAAAITPGMPRWTHEVEVNLAATSGGWKRPVEEAWDDPDASLRTQRLGAIAASELATHILAPVDPEDAHPTDPDARNATAVISLAPAEPPSPDDTGEHEAPRHLGLLIAMGVVAIIFLILSLLLLFAVLRSDDRKNDPPAPAPPHAAAEVHLTSAPDGARVFVDGEFKGLTPLQLPRPHADALILLRKSGYTDVERNLTGDQDTLHVTLDPNPDATDDAGLPLADPADAGAPPTQNTRRRTIIRTSGQRPALDAPPPANPDTPTRRRRTTIPLWDHE